MSGTKEGGRKASISNRARHGEDYYGRIGKLGGSRKVKKGFSMHPKLASVVGKIGGTISRKPPKKRK